MGLPLIVPLSVAAVGMVTGAAVTTVAYTAAAVVPGVGAPAPSIPDIWSLIQTGGAPMALVMFLALIEVTRRHDKAYRTIEAKDAVILEMSVRQTKAMEAVSGIASDQMKIAQNTEMLLRELVALGKGKAGA